MNTQVLIRHPVPMPVQAETHCPQSDELGEELRRLEHERREAVNRQRQEELARLRRIQDLD